MEKLESKVEQDKGFDWDALDRTCKSISRGIAKTAAFLYVSPTAYRRFAPEEAKEMDAFENFFIGGLTGAIGGAFTSLLTLPTYLALKAAEIIPQETIQAFEHSLRLDNNGKGIIALIAGISFATNLASATYESIRASYQRNKSR